MAHNYPNPRNKPHHSNTPTQWTHGCRFKKPKVYRDQYRSLPIPHEPIYPRTTHPLKTDTINSVYKLTRIGRAVGYLHAAKGFPTKVTWIKSIHKGNYLSWPLINVQNVSKHFLESEKNQKGHMRNHRQGVRSTKSCQVEQTNDYKRK